MDKIEKFNRSPQKILEGKENLPDNVREKINDKYSILKRGSLKYIVNPLGKIVSGGYHEFKVFKHGNMFALLGKLGAIERLLKPPRNIDDFFEESPVKFHNLNFDDKLGLLIAKRGARKYIIDMNTGEEISRGYHEFFRKDGKLWGCMGAVEEEVQLFTPELPQVPLEIDGDNTKELKENN